MNRHMLLVGGSRDVHPKVKRLGLRLSLLIPVSKLAGLKNHGIYDRIVALPEAAMVDEWLEVARLIHRLDPVQALGGFNEVTQQYAAAIAQDLMLPFHPAEVIRRTRQKDEMRRVLREAGLDTTPASLVGGAEEIAAFGEVHGYPLVLKPVDGRGSLGISIVRSSRDVAPALAWIGKWAPGYSMLAERFLEGEEWSVEAFSERGRHRVVCVTQKFKDPVTCVEVGHCLPAPLPEQTRSAIEQFVVTALTALGVENGPSHTEVIVTAQGPRIVETHTRLAGDNIVDLIELASGIDLDELWIRQSAGESVYDRIPTRLDRFAAVWFVTPHARGTLERVDGAVEAAAMAGVERLEILQPPGARMEGAHDSFSRGASAIAVGESGADAVARARGAAERLRFVVSCAG